MAAAGGARSARAATPQVRVKLAPQFRDLLADTPQLRVGIRVSGQVAQFFDIFF